MNDLQRRSWLAVIVVVLAPLAALAAEPRLPPLSGRVVDEAGVLAPAAEAQLTELLATHERETSNQVAVATVASLQGLEIEDFAVRLFRAWKLGQQDRDNGVLLLVAPNERRVRIEVGYGLEGALPDAIAHAIIQNEILPRFRAGAIEDGVLRGTRAVIGAIAGGYKPATGREPPSGADPLIVIMGMGVVLFLLFAHLQRYRQTSRRSRSRLWQDEDKSAWSSPLGGFSAGRLARGGRSGGWSGGGGSSGGGGASGRW